MKSPRHVDDSVDRIVLWLRGIQVPKPFDDFVVFVFKQAYAALFGGILLGALLLTHVIWNPAWPIARYDALFLFAILVQIAMLYFRLETISEAKVIALFHITGTVMEWFKVSAGSWAYPEVAVFKVFGVPLFSGFMYASVGSYIARVIRICTMRFEPFPPYRYLAVFALAIYINFFSHHYISDIRVMLFAASIMLFFRTKVYFRIVGTEYAMPIVLSALFSAGALWVAENIGTNTHTWVYAGTHGPALVSFSKFGSWYLLLWVAFATVMLLDRRSLKSI